MTTSVVRRLTPKEVRERRAGGESIVAVDVRTADARELHPVALPGSRWLPLADVVEHTASLPRDVTLLAYCT